MTVKIGLLLRLSVYTDFMGNKIALKSRVRIVQILFWFLHPLKVLGQIGPTINNSGIGGGHINNYSLKKGTTT